MAAPAMHWCVEPAQLAAALALGRKLETQTEIVLDVHCAEPLHQLRVFNHCREKICLRDDHLGLTSRIILTPEIALPHGSVALRRKVYAMTKPFKIGCNVLELDLQARRNVLRWRMHPQ